FGLGWYWFYARKRVKREYSLLHVIERLTGEDSTGYLVDEELREILINRDEIEQNHFKELIKNCEILELNKLLHPDEFAKLISKKLSKKIDIDDEKLYEILKNKENDSNVVIHPGVAIFSHTIPDKDKFEILLVRTKKGLILSDDIDPVYAFFVILASPDQRSFYLHTLMWIAEIAEKIDFNNDWINADDVDDLRALILDSWKKREF
ncbi:MAG: PTS sugar transporter subunit IIA, partial [Candidatus Thermoplasmatota archaeon]